MLRLSLAAALLALLPLACGGDDRNQPVGHVTSFYIEARLEVVSDAATVGANIAVTPALEGSSTSTVSSLRWWSASPDEFRQQFEIQPAGEDAVQFLVVGANGSLTIYEGTDNTYRTVDRPDVPGNVLAYPLSAWLFFGPPFPYDLDDPLAAARSMFAGVADGAGNVSEQDGGAVAGRETRLFEWGPAGCSSTATGTGAATPATECSGTVRAWVDNETGFVLRFESRDEVQSVAAEATHLEYNPATFDSSLFQFQPPPGAVETRD